MITPVVPRVAEEARGGSLLHQQALTVTGLFTALTLTALVLILTDASRFSTPFGPVSGQVYFEIVATYVALLGVMSSVATLAYLEIAGGMSKTFTPLDTLGTAFFLSTVFGFLGVLPLLLAPFTAFGAAVVLLVEAVVIVLYFVSRRLPPRPRR